MAGLNFGRLLEAMLCIFLSFDKTNIAIRFDSCIPYGRRSHIYLRGQGTGKRGGRYVLSLIQKIK
jgi:hypothetical protein